MFSFGEEENLSVIFADVTPIEQNDGEHPVCSIAYSPVFVESMNYLRAILKADERSERALQLTTQCLQLNPANYTVWHFRRRCLYALTSSSSPLNHEDGKEEEVISCLEDDTLERDFQLAARLGGGNPKNYQIWYHRRALLEPFFMIANTGAEGTANHTNVTDKIANELSYVTAVLQKDGKNYHAWSHRQWLVRSANTDALWEEEKEFGTSRQHNQSIFQTVPFAASLSLIDSYVSRLLIIYAMLQHCEANQLLMSDPRNNSAWNQRFFAAHHGTKNPLSAADAREEAHYAIQGAAVDPYNESPWRYLIGIVKEQTRAIDLGNEIQKAAAMELIKECETELVKLHEVFERTATLNDSTSVTNCVNLTSAHIDLLELKENPSSLEMVCV
jgi:protein farnesyltransferase/geranylgeranyltransferase type-1 subunit alpha